MCLKRLGNDSNIAKRARDEKTLIKRLSNDWCFFKLIRTGSKFTSNLNRNDENGQRSAYYFKGRTSCVSRQDRGKGMLQISHGIDGSSSSPCSSFGPAVGYFDQ